MQYNNFYGAPTVQYKFLNKPLYYFSKVMLPFLVMSLLKLSLALI